MAASKEKPNTDDESRTPYQLPIPAEAQTEIVASAVLPDDERVRVPQMENVWFRPLCLNASQGYCVNLLRVRRSGVLTRHRHPAPVHGFVVRGSWRYLEHDWTAPTYPSSRVPADAAG